MRNTTAQPVPKVRALAVTSTERLAMLPDVPTTAEAGVPDYRFATRVGFAAPGKMPEAILARLHKEIARVRALPEKKTPGRSGRFLAARCAVG